MNEQAYWQLINNAAEKAAGDEDVLAGIISANLEKLSADDILKFMEIQAGFMQKANCYNAMYAYSIFEGMPLCNVEKDEFYVSEDGFLYFRLWLIYQPEAVYNGVLGNPDYLADILNPNDEPFYELIAGTAIELYFAKSGSFELPESYMEAMSDDSVQGIRYPVKELPERFPKLWAKFME